VPESTGTSGHAPLRPRTVQPHHGPGPMAAIAGGGALGTLARYGMERALVPDALGFPWATLAVNVVGSFLLGVVVTLVVERWPGDRWLRPLVAVGFCGGFTTFSTFALEVDQRIRHGQAGMALAYVVASLAAGMGAALAGTTLSRGRLATAPRGPGLPDPDLLAGDDDPVGGSDPAGVA
jgi:fluoride exporter